MKKEIFNHTVTYGQTGENTSSLVAEYEYDEFQIDPDSPPCDNVRISVIKDGTEVVHSVYIGFGDLEKIYLAAREAHNNR